MNSKNLFILALIVLSSACFAKPIYVVGNIIEDETGEPIPFATLYTRSGKKLGLSNTKGRFEVEVA